MSSGKERTKKYRERLRENEDIITIIITLFMSEVYLTEHRGSTNWGDRKSNQHKSNQIKCWFLVRGEMRSTQGKPSQSRV